METTRTYQVNKNRITSRSAIDHLGRTSLCRLDCLAYVVVVGGRYNCLTFPQLVGNFISDIRLFPTRIYYVLQSASLRSTETLVTLQDRIYLPQEWPCTQRLIASTSHPPVNSTLSSQCTYDDLPSPVSCSHRMSFRLILLGILISYLPQHHRIISRRSSEGISPYFVLLGTTSGTCAFANILTVPASRRDLACCKELSGFDCAAGVLGIAQVGVQWSCFVVM